MRRYKVLILHKTSRFALLDLDVPARSRGGVQSTENGRKFLDELCAPQGQDTPAAIVLIPADAKCGVPSTRVMDLAARLMQRGAAKEKRRACRKRRPRKATPKARARPGKSGPAPAKPAVQVPFTGGEMVIYSDHVELDGVVVLTDQGTGLMRQILLVLKAKQDGLIHDSLSVKKLAARTDPDADVAKAVLLFRDTVTREMAKERNVHCGRMAVIESGRHGYRYAKGITARVVDCSDEPLHEPPREPLDEPPEPSHEPLEPPNEPPLNERQKWIVAECRAGRRPTRRAIEKATNCSRATAARDLRALRSLGMLKHG